MARRISRKSLSIMLAALMLLGAFWIFSFDLFFRPPRPQPPKFIYPRPPTVVFPSVDPGPAHPNPTSPPAVRPPPPSHPHPTPANATPTALPSARRGVFETDLSGAAIVVMTYNRPKRLERFLTTLYQVEGVASWTVYVSQDGRLPSIPEVATKFPIKETLQKDHGPGHLAGHEHIALHYKSCLDRLFFERNHTHVILFEDDMIVAPDILSFFQQTAWLLDADPTLWCVSTWNDNGCSHLAADPRRLMRNSYFPGLGWMLRRQLWEELSPRFPSAHWDHWMRTDFTSKGRDCVVPEVSRNYNEGDTGSNMNPTDYDKLFRDIVLNREPVVDLGDLSYLLLPNYEAQLRAMVENAQIAKSQAALYRSTLEASPTDASAPLSLAVPQIDAYRANGGFRFRPAVPRQIAIPQAAMYAYPRRELPQLAERFKIWAVPRGHHRSALVLHLQRTNRWVILADAVRSPYVPDAQRILPPRGLRAVVGPPAASCEEACKRQRMRCDEGAFDWVNNCTVLSQYFPCERGFGMVMGEDIPNYVHEPSNENYQRCLITEFSSSCRAKHHATTRLCPCVP